MLNVSDLKDLENLRFVKLKVEGIGDTYSYKDAIYEKFGILVWARDVYIVEFRQLTQAEREQVVFRVEFRNKKAVKVFLTPFVRGDLQAYFTKTPTKLP